MYLRIFYNIFIWYDFIYACQVGVYEEGFDYENRWFESKIPVWVVAAIVIAFNIAEKLMFGGTRTVVLLGGASWQIHFLLFSAKINSYYFPIINNAVLNFKHLVWFWMWCKWGPSDMSSFKTHGPFRPGLKRFKSESGNDCLAFYPVDLSCQAKEIKAYRFPKTLIANLGRAGYRGAPTTIFTNRAVNGLIEDAPIH